MTIGVGFNAHINFGQESTWGTSVARPKSLKIISESMELQDAPEPRKSLGQVTRLGYYKGRKTIAGDVNAEFIYNGLEMFLYNAMGSVSTSSASPNYQHTYRIADPLPAGMSMECEKDAGYFVFEGCMVNTMTFNMTDLEILQAVFSFIGEDQASYSSAAGTASDFFTDDAVKPWTSVGNVFTATLDGAAVTGGIREASITLNNSLSGDRPNLGSRTIQQPVRNSWVEVTGSFTTDFRNESIAEWYTDFVNGTAVAMVFKYQKDANTSIEIDVPVAYYTGETPKVGGPDVVSATLPFIGAYDSTSTALQVVLKNQAANGTSGW